MKQSIFTILENTALTRDVYRMVLEGDTSAITASGQFVNIQLSGKFLRRPISVCDWNEETLTIVYKVVGHGTEQMSAMASGEKLDILTGLGNGYDLNLAGDHPVLIGGGVGVPPMYDTARRLKKMGADVTAILGFATKDVSFYIEKFKALDIPVLVTTDDGSLGRKGFVTDALRESGCDYVFACGPTPMLRAVHKTGIGGQLSFEERMGCGFGACMGCTCHTLVGTKRVCKDGPVFPTEEVTFE